LTIADEGHACYNPRMAIEIERKFLLGDDSWREQANTGVFYSQVIWPVSPWVSAQQCAA